MSQINTGMTGASCLADADEIDPLHVDEHELLVHVLKYSAPQESDQFDSMGLKRLQEIFYEDFVTNAKSLAKVCEEIRLRNMPMSTSAEIFAHENCLDFRFYTNKKDYRRPKTSLEDVKERISTTRSLIKELLGQEGVNDTYLLIARFIAKNVRILKRQLKSTYLKLPWEEIEFCLVIYISTFTRVKESDITYALVLDEARIFNHLKNFYLELAKVESELTSKDLGSAQAPTRAKCVQYIIDNNREFKELYDDFDIIKDVYSLKRIHWYLKEVLSKDFDARSQSGNLAIQRTLQILGECLKSTSTSPHISDSLNSLLLATVPKNVLELLKKVRDSISHAENLMYKIDMETNLDFGSDIQEDLKKLEGEIVYFLYRKKMDGLNIFLKKITKYADSGKVVFYSNIKALWDTNLLQDISVESYYRDVDRIKQLVQELDDSIKQKDEHLKTAFERIAKLIDLFKLRGTKQKDVYLTNIYRMFQDFFTRKIFPIEECIKNFPLDSHQIEHTQLLRGIQVQIFDIESHTRLYTRNENAEKIRSQCALILFNIQFELRGTIRIVNFNYRLEQNSWNSSLKIFEEIENTLETETDKTKFNKELENIKQIHTVKQELLKVFDGEVDIGKCDKKLNIVCNKKQQEKLISYYENNELSKCKQTIGQINDPYGNFLKQTENVGYFTINTKKKAIEDLFKALKLGSLVKEFYNRLEVQAMIYYENRLKILQTIIENKGDRYSNDSRPAIEMLLLDLLEIIKVREYCAENHQYFEEYSPVLVGQNMRNYLAHGDPLVDILPTKVHINIISHAFKLIEEGNDLFKKRDFVIGAPLPADCYSNYEEAFFVVKEMDDVFLALRNGEPYDIPTYILKELNFKSRSMFGMTMVHLAAIANNPKTFELLLKKISVNVLDVNRNIPIHFAIAHGSIDILNFIMSQVKTEPKLWIDAQKLLHYAVHSGQTNIVELFCKSGADTNLQNSELQTPLHIAAELSRSNCVHVLLDNGASVRVKDSGGQTPLHSAAIGGNKEICEELLENEDTNVDCHRDLKLRTPLHTALLHDNVDVAMMLIDRGIAINLIDVNKLAALHLAVYFKQKEVVRKLIGRGAQIELEENNGKTALSLATANGSKDIVEILINNGASLENQSSLLLIAAAKGHVELLNLFLLRKVKFDGRGSSGETAIHVAAKHGHVDAVNFLLENASFLTNLTDNDKNTPLHYAAENGHVSVAEILLNNSFDVNAPNSNNTTPLHFASKRGHVNVVKLLLSFEAIDINVLDSDGLSPLHWSLKFDNEEIVLQLLEKARAKDILHSYVNSWCLTNFQGKQINGTPLTLAISRGNKSIVQILLNNGADFLVVTDQCSVIHFSAFSGDEEIMNLMVEKIRSGFSNSPEQLRKYVDCLDGENCTPLLWAALIGKHELIETLLNNGANINHTDKDGWTALQLAAQNGYESVVQALINRGADITIPNAKGNTAIHTAIRQGHQNTATLLLSTISSSDILNTKGEENCTPLHLAVIKGYESLVKTLLSKGADFLIQNDQCSTLHCAVLSKNLNAFNLILQKTKEKFQNFVEQFKFHIDISDKEGSTPLMWAARGGQDILVEILLNHGANINHCDKTGCTALHQAAHYGYENVIRILLNRGADVAIRNTIGDTAVHTAIHNNQTQVVELLLSTEKSNLIESRGEEMSTPLHLAVTKGHESIVQLLLKKGADLFSKNDNCSVVHCAVFSGNITILNLILAGIRNKFEKYPEQFMQYLDTPDAEESTPLLWAAERGQDIIVEILLDKGCNINRIDKNGSTALHIAAYNGHEKVIKVLLQRNADVTIKNVVGDTVLHSAIRNNQKQIVELLLSTCRGLSIINNKSQRNATPLHLAISKGDEGIVQALLDNGADFAARDDQWYVLHCAILFKNVAIVTYILKKMKETFQNSVGQFRQCVNTVDERDRIALFWAALSGEDNLVEILLDYEADINHRDNKGYTVLHMATANGHESVVKKLIERGSDITAANNVGDSVLHIAILNNRKNIVALVLSTNSYRSIIDKKGQGNSTALHMAAAKGDEDIVHLLLDKGADFLAQNDQCSVLHCAVSSRSISILNLILQKISEKFKNSPQEFIQHLDSLDKDGRTPLLWAAANDQVTLLEILLREGANTNHCDNVKCTAMHLAAHKGHGNVIRILMDKNADMEMRNAIGDTALHTAILNNQGHIVELLLSTDKLPLIVNSKGQGNSTPLHLAATRGFDPIVQMLLDKGADVLLHGGQCSVLHCAVSSANAVVLNLILKYLKEKYINSSKYESYIDTSDREGNSPLLWAAVNDRDILVGILLSNGANINHSNNNGNTALHLATGNGHESVVKILLDKEADCCRRNRLGDTALHTSIRYEHENISLLLLSTKNYTSFVDRATQGNITPLQMAAAKSCEKVVGALLDRDADFLAQNRQGSVLHYAVHSKNSNIVNLILRKMRKTSERYLTVFVNARDRRNRTPLLWAALIGNEILLDILLKNGADINRCDERGCTALHLAAGNGYENIARVLLDNEIDVTIKNSIGDTALQTAIRNDRENFAALLLNCKSCLAVIDSKEQGNSTALHMAAAKGYERIVQLLLEKGADFLLQDDRCGVLHYAAVSGSKAIVNLILTKIKETFQNSPSVISEAVNTMDRNGYTPFTLAIATGNVILAEVLLKNGANILARNDMGMTAIEVAVAMNHTNLSNALFLYYLNALFLKHNAEQNVVQK